MAGDLPGLVRRHASRRWRRAPARRVRRRSAQPCRRRWPPSARGAGREGLPRARQVVEVGKVEGKGRAAHKSVVHAMFKSLKR